MELSGKIALVTGAARGLGHGIALVLAEKGADVVANDLERPDARAGIELLEREIRGLGRNFWFAPADVSKDAEVQAMFRKVAAEAGRLDLLVNNAGTNTQHDITNLTEEVWDFILATNLKSCFLCSRAAVAMMVPRKSGRIVSIASITAHQGALYGQAHYAASKGGIISFSKTLARTLAPHGINVNAVAPGVIETELVAKTHAGNIDAIRAAIPLGLGKPRAVGLAVAFLAGEGGDYITGATLDVNGGMYLR